jgi:SPP1 gp7 family putative phage head morphogenesis protein
LNYWEERILKAQEEIVKKSTEEIEKQLIKYYEETLNNTKGRFLNTYNKLRNTLAKGKEPTPADLYKLDTYWRMSAELRQELTKMGAGQIALLNEKFMNVWEEIYYNLAIKDDTNFYKIDRNTVQQMINYIWCADGKRWSDRIWMNTNKLQEALNEGLIECVLTGASPRQLRERLVSEFNVSWNNADMLVRTEIAHIQTQATQQRYEDMDVKEVYVWADEDERRCEICGALHEKRYPIGGKMPVPAHPRCRCRILPVIDI